MAFGLTLQPKHNNILIYQFMGTMSYRQMMLMVDLISKWDQRAYGGMILIDGGLDLIVTKDKQLDMQIIKKMYFVPIS